MKTEQWNRKSMDFGISKTQVQVRDLQPVSWDNGKMICFPHSSFWGRLPWWNAIQLQILALLFTSYRELYKSFNYSKFRFPVNQLGVIIFTLHILILYNTVSTSQAVDTQETAIFVERLIYTIFIYVLTRTKCSQINISMKHWQIYQFKLQNGQLQ